MSITLTSLTASIAGELIGGDGDALVTGIAGYDAVAAGEVTFVTAPRALSEAEASPALAIIAPRGITASTKPLILVDDPQLALAHALALFDWRTPAAPGVHPTAIIAASAAVSPSASIGPYVVVGERASIGEECCIHAHTAIGDDVSIGASSTLFPHVTIYPRCSVGERVIIHAGSVLGADGLGFHPTAQGWVKIPHIGGLVIEDDVEIGANTTIDRAKFGDTFIGRGTKIDNLVHIAHNVHIGAGCMIVAQVGIAGSTVLGKQVVLAGQVGVKDHVTLGAGCQVAAKGGVTNNIPAGMVVSGFPAREHSGELRREATLRRMPALLDTVKQLEKRVKELEQTLQNSGSES